MRDACCCCYRHSDHYEPNRCSRTSLVQWIFDHVYIPFLQSTVVKVTTLWSQRQHRNKQKGNGLDKSGNVLCACVFLGVNVLLHSVEMILGLFVSVDPAVKN